MLESDSSSIPRILVVDDDATHLMFIRFILVEQNMTCELLTANSAEAGWEQLKETPVDLILLDLNLPGQDGFGFMEKLKIDPDHQETPVIFLTSTTEPDQIVRAFESGALDYISKPINASVLRVRIEAVLHQKALEKELIARAADLEEANQYKNELLSICSHDMRAPLNSIEIICGFLEDALSGAPLEKQQSLLGMIINQSRMGRRLVENLLNLDKIEEGVLRPVPSFFSVAELLNRTSEIEEPQIQENKISFVFDPPSENLVCWGDRELIGQVMQNLVGNALSYTRKKLLLGVDTPGVEKGETGEVIFKILDDGPGIEKEIQPQLFQKYARGKDARSGTGLGLYISRKIVEAHGGSIALESEPGKGALFTVKLPYVYNQEDLPQLTQYHGIKTAILSDTPHSAKTLESILLQGEMVDVETYSGKKEDLKALVESRPQLVVVDLLSPLNDYRLSKAFSGLKEKPEWIFYGEEIAVEAFSKIMEVPYSHLKAPLNPRDFLWLMGAVLTGEKKVFATFGG